MRWLPLILGLIAALPGGAAAQTCNGQTENVLVVQTSRPEGAMVSELLSADGIDVTVLGPAELAAADLDAVTRIVVSSAQDEAFYADLAAARPGIDLWLDQVCCRVLQWHGHGGPDLDLPAWYDAPAGLRLDAEDRAFDHAVIAVPGHTLVAGMADPVVFPQEVPFARGTVDTDAATAEVVIVEVESSAGLLIDFEAGPSRVLATTIHVESFATVQPQLLDNLLSAQADEAHCDTGDDDDSAGDDDDSAGDDDDSADDDDDTVGDDDDTTPPDDDDDDGDDDSAAAFERCDTRDEYGWICGLGGRSRGALPSLLLSLASCLLLRRRSS